MEDFEIIMQFKNMKTIGEICKELKVDYSNLISGKSTKANEHRVAQALKLELYKINLLMGEK